MLVSKQLFLKYVLNKRPENLSLEPCLQDFVNKFLRKIYEKLLSRLADFGH